MSVIHIHEIWKGRDADGSVDDTRYQRVFRIWTDSGADDGAVVGTALALPPWNIFPGAVYPTDPRAFCIGAKPNNDIGNKGWICAATFSTKRELAALPQDDEIQISFDEEDMDVPVLKDRDGKAVLNSAGDYPDPPPMASDSIMVAKIALNVAALPAYVRAYRKSINLDAFTIEGMAVDAKHARVRKIALGNRKYRGSNPFREVSIDLAITDNDEDDWEIRFLDAGFRRINTSGSGSGSGSGGGTGLIKIVNDDQTEPTAAVLLDGNGQPLSNPTPDNAVYRTAGFYRLKAFVGNIPGCT